MKIEHILADNFLRLNLLDADLTGATVHLFAGSNEAGKSSVQEAVRFAMTGEVLRVSKKGDYKLMIRDGAKSGSVAVKIDGIDIVRDVKSADLANENMGAIQIPDAMPYLMNAQLFAHKKDRDRRSFLIDLTGTSVDPDDVGKRMKAKGVHEACIDEVKPMIRSSFDAAHGYAVKKKQEIRANWEGLTGRKYGTKLAEDWKPEPPEGFDPQALLDGEQLATKIKERIDKLNIEKGRLSAQIDDADKVLKEIEAGGEYDPDALAEAQATLAEFEADLETGRRVVADLNHRIANAREKVPVTCCECGTQLRVSFSGATANVEKYEPLPDDELQRLNATLHESSMKNGQIERDIATVREEIAGHERRRAIAAAGEGKTLPSEAGLAALKETLMETDDRLDEENASLGELDNNLATLRNAANQIRDAEKIAERAGKYHRGHLAWGKCAETLAPDGIPAEILSDTLKPVNDRMRNTANLTGWPQVTIDATMEVVVDGRRYSLLSESARWRADAAIADAISHLSGLGLLMIDRFDVLDVESRGSFLKWMNEIKDEYDTILIFGTLKQLPKCFESVEGFKAHWMENGEIREVA